MFTISNKKYDLFKKRFFVATLVSFQSFVFRISVCRYPSHIYNSCDVTILHRNVLKNCLCYNFSQEAL